MKYSLGVSNFLEVISSLSHSVVFLYFFALITEEDSYLFLLFFGTLHSDAYIFPFLLCFSLLFFSQLFVRPPQTAILLFLQYLLLLNFNRLREGAKDRNRVRERERERQTSVIYNLAKEGFYRNYQPWQEKVEWNVTHVGNAHPRGCQPHILSILLEFNNCCQITLKIGHMNKYFSCYLR